MYTEALSDRLFDEKEMDEYIRAYCRARQLDQAERALDYAADQHRGQFRKPGHAGERVPYINHPLLVTCHALALGLEEEDLLTACLLHDVCEDCGVPVADLPVSDAAKEAVELLTKPEDFEKTDPQERAYYDGIAGSRIASMVKLLDRCSNVSLMAASFPDPHMKDYIRETRQYVYPLLDRTREAYPQYARQLFLIRYHMTSVVESLLHRLTFAGT